MLQLEQKLSAEMSNNMNSSSKFNQLQSTFFFLILTNKRQGSSKILFFFNSNLNGRSRTLKIRKSSLHKGRAAR